MAAACFFSGMLRFVSFGSLISLWILGAAAAAATAAAAAPLDADDGASHNPVKQVAIIGQYLHYESRLCSMLGLWYPIYHSLFFLARLESPGVG